MFWETVKILGIKGLKGSAVETETVAEEMNETSWE